MNGIVFLVVTKAWYDIVLECLVCGCSEWCWFWCHRTRCGGWTLLVAVSSIHYNFIFINWFKWRQMIPVTREITVDLETFVFDTGAPVKLTQTTPENLASFHLIWIACDWTTFWLRRQAKSWGRFLMSNTDGNSWSILRILCRTWIPGAWNKYDSLGCNRRFRLGFWCRPKESPNLLKFSIVFGLHFDQIFQDLRKFELSSFDFDLFRLFCVPLCFDELFSLTENVCCLNRSMAWLFLRSTALFWRII